MVTTTALSVLTLLLYALPGFILRKSGITKEESIPSFAKVLLFVCQPCLTLYSFSKIEYSLSLLWEMGVFFLLALVSQLGLMLIAYFILRRFYEEKAKYRIFTIATVISNCGFFGVPVVEKLFPEKAQGAALCMVFSLAMNILCWTLVLFIVTGEKKYIKLQRVFVNPSTISFFLALVMFILSLEFPSFISEPVTLLGRMATPMCMLILGMRLGGVSFVKLFSDISVYATVLIKQIIAPGLIFFILLIFPMDIFLKELSFILFCCPVASNVLNFAELSGKGQEEASSVVLLGTIASILTMPLMMLLLSI